MVLLLNIVWFIFGGGIISWALWMLLGGLLFITVVGIPFAYAAFRIAGYAAFPFGKRLVDVRDLGNRGSSVPGLPIFYGLSLPGSGWPYPIFWPGSAFA